MARREENGDQSRQGSEEERTLENVKDESDELKLEDRDSGGNGHEQSDERVEGECRSCVTDPVCEG